MRRAILTAVAVTLLLIVTPALAFTSSETTPTPTPTPTATPTPTPSPATPEVMAATKLARQRAMQAWKANQRARSCFKRRAHAAPKPLPRRAATDAVWIHSRTRYRALTQHLRAETKTLRHRMTHPGGSSNGVRWLPLARWVGWPEHALPELAAIIMRESSGRERAWNGVIGCTGLLQIWPGNLKKGERASWLMDPTFNLTVGLRIWRAQHGSFLPAWGL